MIGSKRPATSRHAFELMAEVVVRVDKPAGRATHGRAGALEPSSGAGEKNVAFRSQWPGPTRAH